MFIFDHLDREELLIRSFLALFEHTSWLHTNFAKCSVSPIGCSDKVGLKAASVMECQLAPFLNKYLRIPLRLRKSSCKAFQPLEDMIANRLGIHDGKGGAPHLGQVGPGHHAFAVVLGMQMKTRKT